MEGTDLWYKTYLLRRDLRALYHLSPDDTLIPYDAVKELYSLRSSWRADPLNPERFNHEPDDPTPQDALMSVLSLPDAPSQPWIHSREDVPKGMLQEHTIQSNILQNERSITVYTPPGYPSQEAPYPLFILFTGYYYNNPYIPGPTILNNMIAKGVIPPLVTVFLGKSPNSNYEYSCNPLFSQFLERELVPWLREHYQVTTDQTRTVIGGVSYTGMTAAFTALNCPGTFGNVLSQSGYFAWKPAGEEDPEWLTRQFEACSCLPLRFYLDVGLLENDFYDGEKTGPSLLLSNRHLRDVLQAKGYKVFYQEFNGAHDGVSWRGTWSDGLVALLVGHEPSLRK
jgi:enterochelin esterase family protein